MNRCALSSQYVQSSRKAHRDTHQLQMGVKAPDGRVYDAMQGGALLHGSLCHSSPDMKEKGGY